MSAKKSKKTEETTVEETVVSTNKEEKKPRSIVVSMTDVGKASTSKVKTTTELYMESE